MKGRWAAACSLMALLILVGWTTNKSSGTAQKTFAFATTGNAIPDSASAGRTYLSVADLAGTGTATLWIYSEDVDGAADSMLVTIGAGSAWETNCPDGIDSVVVVTNSTTLGFHVSN